MGCGIVHATVLRRVSILLVVAPPGDHTVGAILAKRLKEGRDSSKEELPRWPTLL